MKKNIKINIPSNYESQLPNLAHIDHPVFKQRLEYFLKDEEGVKKFLLATGDLNDSIHQSLDLIVSDEKLNEGTSVQRLLDPKFPKNVMQKAESGRLCFSRY